MRSRPAGHGAACARGHHDPGSSSPERRLDPGGSSSESTAAAPFDPCVDSLPEAAPSVCTMNMGATTFSLGNDCASRRFRLIWIPGSCEESASVFDVLDPGDVSGWNTSVGAVWRVRDEDTGELVMDIPPLGANEMLTIP